MLDKALLWLLENAEQASIIAYLLVLLIFLGTALALEWLVLGKVYHRLVTAYDKLEMSADTAQDALTEQKVLNGQYETTITFLRERIAQLELELAGYRGTRQREGPQT